MYLHCYLKILSEKGLLTKASHPPTDIPTRPTELPTSLLVSLFQCEEPDVAEHLTRGPIRRGREVRK